MGNAASWASKDDGAPKPATAHARHRVVAPLSALAAGGTGDPAPGHGAAHAVATTATTRRLKAHLHAARRTAFTEEEALRWWCTPPGAALEALRWWSPRAEREAAQRAAASISEVEAALAAGRLTRGSREAEAALAQAEAHQRMAAAAAAFRGHPPLLDSLHARGGATDRALAALLRSPADAPLQGRVRAVRQLLKGAREMGRGEYGGVYALPGLPRVVAKQSMNANTQQALNELLAHAVMNLATASGAVVAAPWLYHAELLPPGRPPHPHPSPPDEAAAAAKLRAAYAAAPNEARQLLEGLLAAMDVPVDAAAPASPAVPPPPHALAAAVRLAHNMRGSGSEAAAAAKLRDHAALSAIAEHGLVWILGVGAKDASWQRQPAGTPMQPTLRAAMRGASGRMTSVLHTLQRIASAKDPPPAAPALAHALQARRYTAHGSCDGVLLQERLYGMPLKSVLETAALSAGQTAAVMVQAVAAAAAFTSATGWAHNDLHGGNVMVVPPAHAGCCELVTDLPPLPPLTVRRGDAAAAPEEDGWALRVTVLPTAAGGVARLLDFGMAAPMDAGLAGIPNNAVGDIHKLGWTLAAGRPDLIDSHPAMRMLDQQFQELERRFITWEELQRRGSDRLALLGTPRANLQAARRVLAAAAAADVALPGVHVEVFRDGRLPPLAPAAHRLHASGAPREHWPSIQAALMDMVEELWRETSLQSRAPTATRRAMHILHQLGPLLLRHSGLHAHPHHAEVAHVHGGHAPLHWHGMSRPT